MKWNSNKNAQADGGDRTGEKARTVGKIRGGRHTAEIGKSLASIGACASDRSPFYPPGRGIPC